SWPARLYPCNSETNIRPRSSQHTAEGDAMSGSLATTSMRKPSGSLNAAALCSGVMGLGASVGFGICAKARLAANNRGHANAVDFRLARHGIGQGIEIRLCEIKAVNISSSCRLRENIQPRFNALFAPRGADPRTAPSGVPPSGGLGDLPSLPRKRGTPIETPACLGGSVGRRLPKSPDGCGAWLSQPRSGVWATRTRDVPHRAVDVHFRLRSAHSMRPSRHQTNCQKRFPK